MSNGSSRRFFDVCLFAGAALACLAAAPAARASAGHASQPEDIVLPDIELRQGVTADIRIRVLHNPDRKCNSNTVLAVHGAAATASALERLGHALFDRPQQKPVCNFVSVDLPGHGGSSLPQGALFGELTIQDYAAAVLGTLERLDDRHIRPTTLIGHSMGGLVLQVAQQELVDSGSSLRDAFGVKRVTLLAPAMPAGLTCAYCDDPSSAGALGQFVSVSPTLGPVVQVPDYVWPFLSFMALEGFFAPSTPSPQEVAANAYNSAESLTALGQLFGAHPEVDADVFAKHFRTKLEIVSFEHDVVVRPIEAEALYEHLTGRDALAGFSVVVGADAVHGMPMGNPVEMLAQLDEPDDD